MTLPILQGIKKDIYTKIMKRFVNNLPNGTPIINSDFHDILQDQHRIAYSSYYDGLNDEKYSTFSSDRGIIIKGCEISNVTVDSSGIFEYVIDFNDSLVYFDGQFCEPDANLLENGSSKTIPSGFYLYPVTSSRSADFRDGTTQSIAIDYKFDYATNLSLIAGLPYISFQNGGTSRRLSRLLRFNSAVKDDILISSDVVKWDVNSVEVWRDFDLTGLGRNEMKGFRILTEMGGRFMVGYDGSLSPTPVSAGLLQFNYGTPSNYGGTHSLTFSKTELPAHNHGGSTGTSSDNGSVFGVLNHSHQVRLSWPSYNDDYSQVMPSTPPTSDYLGYKHFSRGRDIVGVTENFLTRKELYITVVSDDGEGQNQADDDQFDTNTDISSHTHSITSSGANIPHENRPPYTVVLYYTKI